MFIAIFIYKTQIVLDTRKASFDLEQMELEQSKSVLLKKDDQIKKKERLVELKNIENLSKEHEVGQRLYDLDLKESNLKLLKCKFIFINK